MLNKNGKTTEVKLTARDIRKLEECSSGREFGQWLRDREISTNDVGSFIHGQIGNGDVNVPNSARAMPKPDRQMIVSKIKALLLVAVGLGLFALVVYVNYIDQVTAIARAWGF